MSQNRQLAAIMFTDIEGYTSLMQRDEKGAVSVRERHRETFELTTEAFNGEIIQYFGDGTLSIFKSTVEAVDCAIEMQKSFLKEPIVPVRIGIHVGDIIRSKDDIIGDAVNVASRIESCAEVGSVLISDKVHDQIRSHRHIRTKFLDAFEFKNVDDAIPVFAIANEGLVVPNVDNVKGKLKERTRARALSLKKNSFISLAALVLLFALALTLSYKYLILEDDKKIHELSIAVLPFDNLSIDEDSEIFRDGITEDILTHLAKLSELHVISRTSVNKFKGTKLTTREIAKKLGVSYVLQGSIRKYGSKLRVTTQLVLAATDEIIMVEQYDRTITDIFQIQSDVSREIVQALDVNISPEQEENISLVNTTNIEAYKLFLQGRQEADKRNREGIAKSIVLYEEAIKIDSLYAEAYAEIANSVYLQTYYAGRDHIEAAKLANEYVDKAEKINPNISRIYSVRGLINNIERNYDEAAKNFEKAIALSPSDLTAHHQYSTYFLYTGQYEKQIAEAEIAYKLDPLSFVTANVYVSALTSNEQYDKAESVLKTIEEEMLGVNKFVVNRSFFRVYLAEEDYHNAIERLIPLANEQVVYNRFLAFCYGKIGDTAKVYQAINKIKKSEDVIKDEMNHQIAISFGGIQETDSILYYLDTIRNNQTRMLRRDGPTFFKYLKDDEVYIKLLNSHGIPTN
jgi:TolB-like protein/tetratricopeptide (TPR) repeat protein